MRTSKLTLMIAGLGMLLATGCFVTTEADRYTDSSGGQQPGDEAGSGNGGNDCSVGAPGCACTQSGACDIDLECVDMLNICVVPTGCDIGSPGCQCTQGGTCDVGLMCADVEPSPGICVSDNPCLDENIGTESCQCTMGGGCDEGLDCLSGLCVNLPEPESTGADPTTTGDTSDATTTGAESSTGQAEADSTGTPTSG